MYLLKRCLIWFSMYKNLKGLCKVSYPSTMNSTCVVYTTYGTVWQFQVKWLKEWLDNKQCTFERTFDIVVITYMGCFKNDIAPIKVEIFHRLSGYIKKGHNMTTIMVLILTCLELYNVLPLLLMHIALDKRPSRYDNEC